MGAFRYSVVVHDTLHATAGSGANFLCADLTPRLQPDTWLTRDLYVKKGCVLPQERPIEA